MAEAEEVVAPPLPSDFKRKHEDLEPQGPEPPPKAEENENAKEATENDSESVKKSEVDESETKRPRLDAEEMPDGLVTENGIQEEEDPEEEDPEEEEEEEKEAERPSVGDKSEKEDAQQPAEKAVEMVNTEDQLSTDDNQTKDIQPPSVENPQLESADEQPSGGGELKESLAEFAHQGDDYSAEQQPVSESQSMSRKMEVPNNKVGVLIGKAGETIRLLQGNSGAKIQITRDSEADPYSTTRLVELIGTLENINKAEKLIKDVIAEAELGGSPSLVARGFNTLQAAGADEQILIQVPHDKVGVIIGKGGETIKNLQTRSGARIQLIPQHLPEGDQSKDRTVRVTGDKKQIEMAREMIKDAMNQPVRPSRFSGGYNQQVFRPRGPAASQQWGPRGARPVQPAGYDYQQRGPHPSQNSHYPNQAYGNYPPQMASGGSSFGPAWEQRPPSTMQGPPAHSGGYDYYGRQSHMVDAPRSVPQSNPVSAHGPGPSPASMGPPPSHGNYNYGQPHASEYGQPAPYSQAAPPQSYGQNQAPYGASQPGGYPQGTHPGYAPQDQYGKAQSYGMQPQGPPSQQYSQPRASQPGDVPYQGPISSTQPYGQNAAPQQTYPYVSTGPVQQTYPPYGSAPTTDGYNQLQPAAGAAPVYPQQGGQPAAGYVQPGGQQQVLGYAQAGPTGGYASYPSAQPGYTEQPTQNNAGYGYQGTADPAYASAPGSAYVAPATAQAGYAQPAAPTQAGYGYPQYDSTQAYGVQR